VEEKTSLGRCSVVYALRPGVSNQPAVSQLVAISSCCIVWFQVVISGVSIEISCETGNIKSHYTVKNGLFGPKPESMRK